MRYSELCEIGLTRILDEAQGADGLIRLKLEYLAEKNGGSK
jgi:hypothetical protein